MYQWNTGRMCIPAMVILGVIIAVNGSADLNTARAEYEVGKLVASDGAAGNGFGYSMAASGDTAVIGAPLDDDNGTYSGSAYVFRYDGSNWIEQAKLLPADGASGDFFGYSVAISGDTIVVGTPLNDVYTGSAYVFRQDPGSPENWIQEAKLLPADGAEYDYFGYSVAVSGNVVVVGAVGDDDNADSSGSAYVFRYDAGPPGNWVQEAKLVQLYGSGVGDSFGSSVAVSGDTALISAPYDDDNGIDSGTAYIFQYDESVSPGTWIQAAKLRPSGIAGGNAFGTSVAISGNTALIGETNYGNTGADQYDGHGAVNVYVFDGSTWYIKATLLASDKGAGDLFGTSLALSGDTAVIGAYGNDDNGPNSGSAYLFRYDGSAWDQMAKYIASNGVENDHLGISVAVYGDMALVGAYGDDDFTGSAYLFNPSSRDCNENGTPDIYDIADGTSGDCNTNDIPDECEPQDDCNNNGIQDLCDIAPGGASDDCNGNGIPDECDVIPGYEGFADAVHYGITGEGISITATDVDGDGDLDLIVVTHYPDDTVILLNNGDGTFQPAGSSQPPAASQTADVEDLNGDGYPDLILLDSESDKVTVRLNNGDGTFGDPTDYAVGSYPLALAIENMDGDTDPDLVTVNHYSNDVSFLLNHGDGTFAAVLSQPVGWSPTAMAVADFNGDGIPDLAVADQDESHQYAISVLLNHSGSFSQDCNVNQVPDECEAGANITYESGQLSPFGYQTPQRYVIATPPAAGSDVTVTLTVMGDFENNATNCLNEHFNVDINGMYFVPHVLFSGGFGCRVDSPNIYTFVVPAETYNAAVDETGTIVITMLPNFRVNAYECNPASYVSVAVEYQALPDCNGNGLLDVCDLASGTSQDFNGNGMPDECDPDCNNNNIWDDLDITHGTSLDCNTNQVPDECDLTGPRPVLWVSDYCSGAPAVSPGTLYWGSMVDTTIDGFSSCDYWDPRPDAWYRYTPVSDGTLTVVLFASYYGYAAVSVHSDCPGTADNELACNLDYYRSVNAEVSLDVTAGVSYIIRVTGYGYGPSEPHDEEGFFQLALFGPDGADCDNDCNANGVPDECEPQGDCNENGVQDMCDLSAGTSQDCDANAIPDDCEVDTDSDGVIDVCDDDDDGDGILDDGDNSGTIGDAPCTGGETMACDDNCLLVVNSDQLNGDADGFGDACDACPNTIAGVPVDGTGCPSTAVLGDMDRDGDVDLADFGLFQICLAGGNVTQLDPSCELALLNEGNYVDQVDLAIFHGCMSGANIPADPGCAD